MCTSDILLPKPQPSMVSLLPNAAADAAHSSVKHFKRPLLHNNDFSPVLICCLCLYALSSFNYGFDVQAMAALQAMTPFARQFGVFSPKTETWKLEPYYLSLLNSCHAPAQILGQKPPPMMFPRLREDMLTSSKRRLRRQSHQPSLRPSHVRFHHESVCHGELGHYLVVVDQSTASGWPNHTL